MEQTLPAIMVIVMVIGVLPMQTLESKDIPFQLPLLSIRSYDKWLKNVDWSPVVGTMVKNVTHCRRHLIKILPEFTEQSLKIWIILGMGSANERRRCTVTSSLIGWIHTQNGPWKWLISEVHISKLIDGSVQGRRNIHFQATSFVYL